MELRIILVDDHPTVRFGLRGIIESQDGWKVVGEANDGEAGLKLATQESPDIVIADLSMPLLGGIEFTQRLRKLRPTIEVLILTMHYSEAMVGDAIAAGARGYILKTDSPRIIQAAIESVASRQAFFNSSIAPYAGRDKAPGVTAGAVQTTSRLTPRERQIVKLLGEGNTNKDVALRLGISVKTADVHRTNIMRRLGIHTVAELVRYAIRERIIEP